MNPPRLLYHGGVPGLWVGDVIRPNMAEHRHVDGCAVCRAQAEGRATGHGIDPQTPADWVYATADKPYARYYASRAVGGTLYRVQLVGDVEPSVEDPPYFPTWRGRSATVVAVLEYKIALTHKERRQLFRRWGGTDAEYAEMVASVAGGGRPLLGERVDADG